MYFTFHRLNSEEHIQMVTALALQLIQCVVKLPVLVDDNEEPTDDVEERERRKKKKKKELVSQVQFVMLGTSPMPPTSKNKSGLLKVPVHFNVY